MRGNRVVSDNSNTVWEGSDKCTRQVTSVELAGSIFNPLVKQWLAAFKGCAVVILV